MPIVPVSGITGEGVDKLLENLALIAEVADLRACPEQPGEDRH